MSDFTTEWEKLRHKFQRQDEQFINEFNKFQGTPDQARKYLTAYAQDHSMRISLYNRELEVTSIYDYLDHGVMSITLQDDFYTDKRHRYSFTFTHPVTWEMLGNLQTPSNMLGLIAILFCLSTISLGIYSRRLAMLPLITLYRRHGKLLKVDPKRCKNKMEWEAIYTSLIQVNESLYEEKRKQFNVMGAISHDIKTPLTSIKGYVERLMNGRVYSEEKRMEYYRIIYRKALDIEKMTLDLSEYVQNESQPLLVKKNVHLLTFLDSIAREYKEELQNFQSEFCFSWDVRSDQYLNVDEQQIRRVFANIVQNSLNHSSGQVCIFLRAHIQQDMVVFRLQDNGPGVPKEELLKIFDPFYCVNKARSKEKNGSGLGLAISKGMIENHDGQLFAYLPEEGGLGITIKLPLAEKE